MGSNYIAVGIHTGTIILFKVSSDTKSFICSVVDSQRCHVNPISDLASTSIVLPESEGGGSREILASGDEIGQISIWQLEESTLKHLKTIEPYGEFPVTTLSLWNRVAKGVIIAGYGSGKDCVIKVAVQAALKAFMGKRILKIRSQTKK